MSGTLATAGVLRRAPAMLIDTLPAFVGLALCFGFGVFDAQIFQPTSEWFWTEWLFKYWLDDRAALVLPVMTLAGLSIAWTAIWEALAGRSPGAMLVRLAVVDRRGARISAGRAGLRAIGAAINVATLGLGYLWIFVSRYRRGWHDLLAGSFVVADSPAK